jgi:membrane protein DedA with SNARE-associated domain
MLIDHIYFWIGRRHGARWLARHPALTQKSANIRYYLERHQILLMLSLRFLIGLRTITPILLGVARISGWRFLCCNLISAALWASAVVLLGRWFAHLLRDWWHWLHPHEALWLGGLIVFGLLFALCYRIYGRKTIK